MTTVAASLSLSEFVRRIKQEMDAAFPDEYWIRGETSDVRHNRNGHCYLELLERNEQTNTITAKIRAYIWSNVFPLLRSYFEEKTGQVFTSGLKVLVKVSVEFHPVYGMGLNILDIDPAYTLGDMQQRRQQILNRLEEEGVIAMNKELELSLLPQRIAVITSPTAAGYEDFMDHLTNNLQGFVFYPKLFPAVMQGEATESSIISALEKIFEQQDQFDAVVIIRGGGATSDLAAFDSYLLALHCAQFPLPVITGIGHERDNSVLDYVSYYRAKTPTAVADYLVEKLNAYNSQLIAWQQFLIDTATTELSRAKEELRQLYIQLPVFANQAVGQERYKLNTLSQDIKKDALLYIKDKKDDLANKESFFKLSSPQYILSRGYAIVYNHAGKVVKSVAELQQGEVIITRMNDGAIDSRVL